MNSKGEKMNSRTNKQEFIRKQPIKAILQYLRFLLPLLVVLSLVACSSRILYIGTCDHQTKQFLSYINSLVTDELNPVIADGFALGPTVDVMNRIDELAVKAGKMNIPECNTGTKAAKDALRQYIAEVKNYFNIVAGRSVYGEGPVQGQRTKVYEAGLALEDAMDDLRR
jgi:hypothetical protein